MADDSKEWQGAEARVRVSQIDGQKCIVKHRFSKSFRHSDLDKRLTRQRTANEARCLNRALARGLPVPAPLMVSPNHGLLILRYVEGSVTVKECLDGAEAGSEIAAALAKAMGDIIARLHLADMVHGDLTTSNFLTVAPSYTVYIIDFGLASSSASVEDKAVDLYVLERAILSTHSVKHPLFFKMVLEEYVRGMGGGEGGVMKRFEEVRARGRKRM
jgi:TP53 regulating kinase-like protein